MADMEWIYGNNHVRRRSEVSITTLSTEIEDLMRSLEEEIKTGNKDGIKLLRDVLDQKLSEAKNFIAKIDDDDDDDDAQPQPQSQGVSGTSSAPAQSDTVSAAQAAADVIQDFLNDRKAFSAWNVTVAVRDKGIRVRHGNLKDVVHNAFAAGDMGDYLRELFQLSGMPIPANLYSPPEFDTDEYNGEAVSAQDVAPDADDVDDDVTQDDDDDDDDSTVNTAKFDTVRKMSIDGTLYLPKSLTQGIKQPAASKALDAIVVGDLPSAPSGSILLTRDAKGNVRLTRMKIKRLGLQGLSTTRKFGITEDDGELTISSAD